MKLNDFFAALFFITLSCVFAFADGEYQVDDGIAEFGINSPVALSWGNMFAVEPSCEVITNISIGFRDIAPVQWRIFGDDDGDPTSGLVVLDGGVHNVVNDFFETQIIDNIDVRDVDVSAFNFFFVSATQPEEISFQGLLDFGGENFGQSWTVLRELNPESWSNAFNTLDNGLLGDWVIRATAVSAGLLLGDVNCDGSVDLLDVGPFIEVISSGQFEPKADLNEDGVIDLLDIGPFVDAINDN